MATDSKHKIVIDTDCGIDDALALLLVLDSKDVAEVLAITCCFGNTSVDNAVSNVMRVLSLCNEMQIPVHRGCSDSIIRRPHFETVHGEDGLGNSSYKFSTKGLKENEIPASLALINIAKKHPHQVTVVAIGPLTNLAIAMRIDPAFTENLKSLVIMGGNYKGIGNVTDVAEFNFYCDPVAANIIVSEVKCPIMLIPWETCMEYGIKWDIFDELIKIETKKGEFFKSITAYSKERGLKKGNKQQYDCDFLAIMALLYPQSVKSRFKSQLAVEYEGKLTQGLTVLLTKFTDNSRPNIDIITHFDMDFLNLKRKRMLA